MKSALSFLLALPALIGGLSLTTAAAAAEGSGAVASTTTGTLGTSPALLARLQASAPQADPEVLALALEARACAVRHGDNRAADRLAVIDYSRPSTERRMWVFDLSLGKLLYAEHVAHGRGSGENMARAFSNIDGSHQTSLGLFRTAETYQGGNGYSLRMDGLEPGINDKARDRLIVMHGAPYVNPNQALAQGRLGRSYGCPAVRPQVAREVIDTLKGGHFVFAYYPDRQWLQASRFFKCGNGELAQRVLAGRGSATL